MRSLLMVVLAWASLLPPTLAAVMITEDFSADPAQHGWAVAGDPSLFQWDSTNQNLRVTWDSSKTNSYFYHRLDTILARTDDYSLAFDLRLDSIGAGTNPAKNATFPIAVGLINLEVATSPEFVRGTGTGSPDLAEFAYFWDSGFGATAWPTVVSTNSTFNYNGRSDYAIFALSTGDTYRIALGYTASDQTLVTTITNLQTQAGVQLTQVLNASFTDYRLSGLSVSSYSDAGQSSAYAGSVLAQGAIDNILARVPLPPIENVTGTLEKGAWQARLSTVPGWFYMLERSPDLHSWSGVLPAGSGTSGPLVLFDTNLPPGHAFYRVRAERP